MCSGTDPFLVGFSSLMGFTRVVFSLLFCLLSILMICSLSLKSKALVVFGDIYIFVGAVCYADDIALINPSPSALRLMLRTCSEFASSHSLIFNTSKTQLIGFSCCPSSRCGLADFSFNGEKLKYSKT